MVFYHLEQRVVSEALCSPSFAQDTAPTLALDLKGDIASRIAQDDGRNIVSISLLVRHGLHFPEQLVIVILVDNRAIARVGSLVGT